MAKATHHETAGGDVSDADINRWWDEQRQSGQTDKEIQRGLVDIMVQSYKEILLELDAVQLARFEAESFPHWFGAYRPMFPETGHGSDGSGAMRLDLLRGDLQFESRRDMTTASERMRTLHAIYLRYATGSLERTEMLTNAIMGEWLPMSGVRIRGFGQRTGPGSGTGRFPGPQGAGGNGGSGGRRGSGGANGSGGSRGSGGTDGSGGPPPFPVSNAPRWTINLLKPKTAGKIHPKVQGKPDASEPSALARERIQANRYAVRQDVSEVYLGDAARKAFKAPSGKFADVVAKKTDGSHALGEGKGTDMAKLVEQYKVTGAKVGRVSEQEVVIEKLTRQPDYDADGTLKGHFDSPGPNGRVDAIGHLEIFNTATGKWEQARPNGVPIRVIVRQQGGAAHD